MMMHNVAISFSFLIFGGIVLFVIIVSFTWPYRRSMSMIERWATENSLELISANRSRFTLGTPFWAASKNHTIYRIIVQDAYYNRQSGYVLCGSRYWGLWSDRVEVKWDNVGKEKLKNDDFEKPKNDFIKRKNG